MLQDCLRSCVRVPSHFIHAQLFETLWNVAHQAPLSMGFLQTRILEWPPPGDLPDPGIESMSPALQEDSLRLSH